MKSDKDIWSLPSPSHVMKCIERWRSLDLREKTDSEVDSELTSLLNSFETYMVSSLQTHFFKLWRIRKFNYLFKDTSECWEPPAKASKMGRCNAEGTSVLYVSEDIKTPFQELNIQPHEQVYVIKYKTKHDQFFNVKQIVSKEFEAINEDGKPLYDTESMLSYQILREFVRSEFLKPVGKGTEYLHRISASMCRIWFDEEDSDGWIYPSIQTPKERNIALKSKSAKEKLIIEDVRIARLVPKEEVKNHKERFEKHPFYNGLSKVIETDFKGEIDGKNINWRTSREVGGIF